MGKSLKIILIIIRLALEILPIYLLGWLVYKDLVVSGSLVGSYNFQDTSPFISVLRPADRVSEPKIDDAGDYYQNIFNQPIYFDVRLPVKFNMAKVKLKYKNIDQPIFQIGAMVDKERWSFDLKPIENQAVEYLLKDKFHWKAVSEGQTILFEKGEQYEKISDFLNNLPPLDKIAVYNYKIPFDYTIKNYQPPTDRLYINRSLRGSHRFYTYVKNETLDFTFLIQDLNRHQDEDYLSIDVYNRDNLIYSKFVEDDGNISDNLKMSEAKRVDLALGNLPEGVYRLELVTNSDDVVFRQISTRQKYLAFINSIYLADDVGYADEYSLERKTPITFYTNGHLLSARTTHVEGLQTILIDKKLTLDVKSTHTIFKKEIPFGIKSVMVPQSDIKLETVGLFAFTRESYFNPEITTLADGLDFDREAIDYVIANYKPAEDLGTWKEAEVDFNLANYYTLDDKLHFVLSVPYLEENQKGVNLSDIQIELRRLPLDWRALPSRIKNYINNLLNKNESGKQ